MGVLTAVDIDTLRALARATFDRVAQRLVFTDGVDDAHGNPTVTYPEGESYPCRFAVTRAVESDGVRDAQVTGAFVWLPHDATVTGRDRLVIDGVTYAVEGPPVNDDIRLTVQVSRVVG